MSFVEIEAFVKVVEVGGFRAAAKELGVTASAVSMATPPPTTPRRRSR